MNLKKPDWKKIEVFEVGGREVDTKKHNSNIKLSPYSRSSILKQTDQQ